MRIRTIFIISVYGIFVLILSCGSSGNTTDNTMTFQVNDFLVGKTYVNSNLGFSIAPPKECQPLADSVQVALSEQLSDQFSREDFFQINPVKVFLNQANQFSCMISNLPEITISDSSISHYIEQISGRYATENVKQTRYKYNGFEIYQILVLSDQMIQFKLLIPQSAGKTFQVDYLIPKNIYVEKIEAIESSIGTLKSEKGR